MYKAAIWARAKIEAELGQYDETYYDASVRSWRYLKELHPNDSEPDLRIGEILMMTGKNGEAIYPLTEAIKKVRFFLKPR